MPRRSNKEMQESLQKEPDMSRRYRTLADIADALGIDSSTVSLVLSRSPKPSESTRRRVLDFCRRVNFRPNILAQALASGRSNLWGVLFPDIASSFFPAILEGIEEVANANSYTAFLSLSQYDIETMGRQITTMQSRLVEGLIIVPPGNPNDLEILGPLLCNTPYVPIVQPFAGSNENYCIRVDHKIGTLLAMIHLFGLGHRRIAFLSGPPENVLGNIRRDAWKDFLLTNGLEYREDYIAGHEFTCEAGYKGTKELMALPEPPTAIFSSSDYAALGSMEALLDLGMKPGEDISVVGYDDVCCSLHSPVPLTTVCQPKEEIGRRAAQALLAIINGEVPNFNLLQPSLSIRKSTGPYRK